MKQNKAQVFFIIIIILLLIVIAIAVMFGKVLTNETITQKAKIETIKTDGLIMSAINVAVDSLISNPQFSLSTTTLSGFSQGTSIYSISRISSTTTKVNAQATLGKIKKNATALITFSASSTTSTITNIEINYD